MVTMKEECQPCRTIARIVRCKGKGNSTEGHEGPEGFRCIAPLTLTSDLDVGGWSTLRPGHFTPGKDKLLIVYEAGWATGSGLTGAQKLPAAGIRSSNRPARSETLHRLSYPGSIVLSTAT